MTALPVVHGHPSGVSDGGLAPTDRSRPGRRHRWDGLLPVLLVGVAGLLRLWDLAGADRLIFDEVYYARDARDYVLRGVEEGRPAHPPVGKWAIAGGIRLFGWTPFGWRSAAALAGTVTVLLTYLVGLRLLRRRWPAALAALLVAVDGLALTTSRVAMLDVFLALLVVLAVWLLLLDRDARRLTGSRTGAAAVLLGSRYRWAAGVVLGLAVGTKWSGLLAVGGAGLLVVGGELLGRGRAGWRPRRVAAAVAGATVACLVLPTLVYVGTYAGWAVSFEKSYAGARYCAEQTSEQTPCDPGPLDVAATWVDVQVDLVEFHSSLVATHPYRSDPLGWPVLERPVLAYYEKCEVGQPRPDRCVVPQGTRAKIVMLGNPVLWWAALLAYPVVAWRALVRRDASAAVVGVLLASLWLPWVLAGRPGYLFYAVPAVPFVALALALAVTRSPRSRALGAVVALSALAALVFFAPVWYGTPLSPEGISARTWFDSWR